MKHRIYIGSCIVINGEKMKRTDNDCNKIPTNDSM